MSHNNLFFNFVSITYSVVYSHLETFFFFFFIFIYPLYSLCHLDRFSANLIKRARHVGLSETASAICLSRGPRVHLTPPPSFRAEKKLKIAAKAICLLMFSNADLLEMLFFLPPPLSPKRRSFPSVFFCSRSLSFATLT